MTTPGTSAYLRQPTSYLPELESWRGWAILLVVLFHYLGILADGSANAFGKPCLGMKWMAAGNTGVTLFFVLSGFLLARPFITALRRNVPLDVRNFFYARILRVVPLYYIAVLFAWTVTQNAEVLKAFLFINIGFSAFPFSVPWWSLCVEAQFYLILPLTMLLLRKSWGRMLFICGLIVWLGVRLLLVHSPGWVDANASLVNSIFGRGSAFLLGGLLAWFHQTQANERFSRCAPAANGLFFLSLIALLTLLAWYGEVGQRRAGELMPLYHDLEASLWTLVLLASLSPSIWFKGAFINPVAKHLGTISYSLFLIHVPVQFYLIYPAIAARQPINFMQTDIWLRIVISALASWLLAILAHRYIERPFLAFKSRLPLRAPALNMALTSQLPNQAGSSRQSVATTGSASPAGRPLV